MTSARHAPVRRLSAHHARRIQRHPWLRGTALAIGAVVTFTGTGVATAYNMLQGNIDSADVEHLLGDDRPDAPTPDPDDPNAGTPVNVLVMGTDSREGNASIASDQVAGARSDTTIVVHISADRSRVELVSIPRDSLVDIPECMRSDGSTSRAQSYAMFNGAFELGSRGTGEFSDGAACTQRTVEANTGVFIHHFVVIDMSGFVGMVDALGGVPMCIPHDMKSRKAKLDIQAGQQTLDGVTALALARARTGEGLGDGSDTGRIERQQELIAATASAVLTKNLLTDVDQLMRFLSAATSSLTVSSGLAGLTDMAGLAYSLRGVLGSGISFMTIPFGAAPDQPGRVVWTGEADDVWAKIAADEPLIEPEPEVETPAPPLADDTDTGTEPETPVAPDDEATDPTPPADRPSPGAPATVDDLTQTTVCS